MTKIALWRCEPDGPYSGRRPPADASWQQEGLRQAGAWDAIGRWFTDDPGTLDFYAADIGEGFRIVRVDVEVELLAQWSMQRQAAAAQFSRDHVTEYFVDRDIAEGALRDFGLETELRARVFQQLSQPAI